jgi:peptide/nickel transport system permease protein
VLNSFIVLVSINLGSVIIVESTLSFLGAGIPPPKPSWGRMVAEGQQYLASAWWLTIFPGLAVTVTVICVFMLGDWARDYLDPMVRQALGTKGPADSRP